MPTARELLEQADALMRRDRNALAAGDRARPSSTPITLAPRPLAGGAASPRAIQHEPIAPSTARTSLPVHPADAPAFAVPDATMFVPASLLREARVESPTTGAAPVESSAAAPVPDADFPTLTEAVIEIVEPPEGGVVAAGGEAVDVPLLTDAVGAIDVAEVDGLAISEPSLWNEAALVDASLLGTAPDSVAVVPSLEAPVDAPLPGRDPLGLDQPAPGFVASTAAHSAMGSGHEPASGQAGETPADAMPEAPHVSESPEPSGGEAGSSWQQSRAEPQAGFERSPSPGRSPEAEAPGADAQRSATVEVALHGDLGPTPATSHDALAGLGPLRPQPGYDERTALDWSEVGGADASAAVADARETPSATEPFEDSTAEAAASGAVPASMDVPPAASQPAVPSAATGPAPALDDARIAEAVDEIRMQVLQRIDIFTDTTLRAKLGEHLQPLVERASADLVAAINQHVGDLMRTYVAEAIEQEIERWRNGQH